MTLGELRLPCLVINPTKEEKMENISCKTWNSDQSWHHESVFKDKKHTLRITIKRNAYDNQSYANVKRWNGEKWHEVCHRPIEYCVCRQISYVTRNIDAGDFVYDVDSLLEEALAIVD